MVGEELLHADGDQRDQDRGEQSLRPEPVGRERLARGIELISSRTTTAIVALTRASWPKRLPRSYAIAKHATTASTPNVAVTGICSSGRYGATSAFQPGTGRYATIRNSPPTIVSGTTATMPARIADR